MDKIISLSKEEIIDLGNNRSLADAIGYDYKETTAASNGSPEDCEFAIISDSISNLLQLKEELEELGFEVEQQLLEKRDGWRWWTRTNINIKKGAFTQSNETDWTFKFDPEWDENEAKDQLLEFVVGNSAPDDFNQLESWYNRINEYYDEMQLVDVKTTFFLDGANEMQIEYGVSDDDTSYSYDSKEYQLAIQIIDFQIN